MVKRNVRNGRVSKSRPKQKPAYVKETRKSEKSGNVSTRFPRKAEPNVIGSVFEETLISYLKEPMEKCMRATPPGSSDSIGENDCILIEAYEEIIEISDDDSNTSVNKNIQEQSASETEQLVNDSLSGLVRKNNSIAQSKSISTQRSISKIHVGENTSKTLIRLKRIVEKSSTILNRSSLEKLMDPEITSSSTVSRTTLHCNSRLNTSVNDHECDSTILNRKTHGSGNHVIIDRIEKGVALQLKT
uniref:Uncharacterized protein n=1 Tax=Glossina pallidipes TaxID=7398 RepID=A0A1A9ZE27_GLOPL